ncbi:MAG: MFS transporter [Candidatus Helarchaeota archaeon]
MESISPERNLKLLAFAAFVRMLGVSIIDLILVLYAISLGADVFLSGVAVGMFSVSQVVLQIPVAKLSDRIGRKKTLLMGMTVYAMGTFLCGIAGNITQLIFFRFIQGSGAYISVIHAFIGDLFPSEKRGKAMSFYQTGVTLGYAIGLPLGGFTASVFLNLPFFVNFGFVIISWILIYLFVEDIPPMRTKIQHQHEIKINYRSEFFRNKLFLVTIMVDCFVVFVFASLLVFIAPFAGTLGMTTFEVSIFLIPLVLLMTLGFFIGGSYSDRIGRSNTIFVGLSIASCGLLLQSFVQSPLGLILIAAISIFGIGLAWPTIPALILDSISETCRATGASIYNSFRYTANALGPILLGYVINIFSTNPEYPYFATGLISPTFSGIGAGVRVSYIISGVMYIVITSLVFFVLRKLERGRNKI